MRNVIRFKYTNQNGRISEKATFDRGVKEIDYHYPAGEGDKHYARVHYEDGRTELFFTCTWVQFEKERTI